MIGLPPAILVLNIILWTVGTLFTKCLAVSQMGYRINELRLLNRIAIATSMWLYLIYP